MLVAKADSMDTDLLLHLPAYGVLICKACRFAVQPKALTSHLLRHQIYRSDRRRLLDQLGALNLLEPEHVPKPPPDSPPFSHLPVYGGNVCAAPGCGHACVSQKRMYQHWSEQHGEHESRNVNSRKVHLQTFFRGNKICYFEVKGGVLSTSPSSTTTSSAPGPRKACSPARLRLEMSPAASAVSDDSRVSDPPAHLDMQPLKYLHNFTVSSCLWPSRSDAESQDFWRCTIVQKAFKYHFLMYAILAHSALHMAIQATDRDSYSRHRAASDYYRLTATCHFGLGMTEPDADSSEALVAFGRLIGIQRSVQWQVERTIGPVFSTDSNKFAPQINDTDVAHLQEFFNMLRGGVEMLMGLQHVLPLGSNFLLTEDQLDAMRELDDAVAIEKDTLTLVDVPGPLFERIASLPEKLSALRLLPDPAAVETAHACTRALLASTARSYATHESHSLWSGIETFAVRAPDHFAHSLGSGEAWILIIMAHWLPLLRRIERHLWMVKGEAERLLNICIANLDPALVHLVFDLLQVTDAVEPALFRSLPT